MCEVGVRGEGGSRRGRVCSVIVERTGEVGEGRNSRSRVVGPQVGLHEPQDPTRKSFALLDGAASNRKRDARAEGGA